MIYILIVVKMLNIENFINVKISSAI